MAAFPIERHEFHGEWNSPALIRDNLERTRATEYAVNPGLILEESWGMSAAVFDGAGRPAWALSLTGIEPRFQPERQELLGGLLVEEAALITQKLQRPDAAGHSSVNSRHARATRR